MDHPLVSCVMPTWNRRKFIPAAVDCWQRQTYPNLELVILDDGEEPIEDLIPEDPRIRYSFENHRMLTGTKRNRVNELSRGEIICHFDDDDWSAADRVADQVARLRESGKPVTGYSALYFWDVVHGQPLRYRASISGYVCGTTLCYTREFWTGRRFRDKQEASDNDFVYPILNLIAASADPRHMVARIHGCHHTSGKARIREKVPREMLPADFWENDKLRLP
jgi:glycosyltransferase involved in cell wall biosynthesis